MPCVLTTGFTLDCKTAAAGIKNIWLVEFDAKSTLTKSSGEVSAHTLTGGKSYFKYELEKETGSMTWRTIPSTENGTVFYEADLVARLHKVTTAQRNEIKLLAQNRMLRRIPYGWQAGDHRRPYRQNYGLGSGGSG